MKTVLKAAVLLFLITSWYGCKKQDWPGGTPTGSDYFVSAQSIGTFTKSQLATMAAKAGFGAFAPLAIYDVDFYKLTYKINYKGNDISASGLLGIPRWVLGIPSIVSAQHGTMFRYADAPSNFPNSFTGFELLGSAGYVTLLPDYIGYGASENITHPYYDKHYSALAVVNIIKAAKYFLEKKCVFTTKRLFLIGYSEGGYATMAAQEEIETNKAHGLNVTAAAEGAGGYDLTTFLSKIADTSDYSAPSFLALIIKSYNDTYNWNRPYSSFFQDQYAQKIPSLLDGTKGRAEIDAALTTYPAQLFNSEFYKNLKINTKETALKEKIWQNSFLNWYPKSPTRLYHGTVDDAVPFQTSVTTYANFKAMGANKVEFFPIPGGTHNSSIIPMMSDALPWLRSLDK